MTTTPENILDRIRKLLAMSKDTSSPNEAAIAARRARALMDQYQVDELDLATVKADDFGVNDVAGVKTNVLWMNGIAIAAAKLNDCQSVLIRHNGVYHYRFRGFLADTVCAGELYKYLRDECDRQASNLQGVSRADRTAYRQGFTAGVQRQVDSIVREREGLTTSNGTALVVCKNQLVVQHFSPVKYESTKATTAGSRAYFAEGHRAGSRASLNRQVGETPTARIGYRG